CTQLADPPSIAVLVIDREYVRHAHAARPAVPTISSRTTAGAAECGENFTLQTSTLPPIVSRRAGTATVIPARHERRPIVSTPDAFARDAQTVAGCFAAFSGTADRARAPEADRKVR